MSENKTSHFPIHLPLIDKTPSAHMLKLLEKLSTEDIARLSAEDAYMILDGHVEDELLDMAGTVSKKLLLYIKRKNEEQNQQQTPSEPKSFTITTPQFVIS